METIPKIIHYCWFGEKEMPKVEKNYIEGWKKICPDYKIMCWNETNVNLQENLYVSQAYKSKKYAFVSDYFRIKALYEYGGIYLDTDVELLKSFDDLLFLNGFTGFERKERIMSSTIASKKGNSFLKEILDEYTNRPFILSDGRFDTTANVIAITNILINKHNLVLDNTYQDLDCITIFPNDYFCACNHMDHMKLYVTNNTYCIHHFIGSWLPKSWRIKRMINKIIFGGKK